MVFDGFVSNDHIVTQFKLRRELLNSTKNGVYTIKL